MTVLSVIMNENQTSTNVILQDEVWAHDSCLMFHPLYAFLSLLTNCIALWRSVLEFVRQLLLFGIAKPKTELPLWLINLQLQAMSPHINRTRHPSPRLERKKGKGKHKIQSLLETHQWPQKPVPWWELCLPQKSDLSPTTQDGFA